MYNKKDFTWGYELELGDIPRDFIIPEELGAWEYCETDILNLNPPYALRACDPLGIDPPVGGEINTKPTHSWPEQVDRIMEIIEMFKKAGHSPTASCINEGHIHVYVPGLKEDIEALKRLTLYVQRNQKLAIEEIYAYREHPLMKETKTARTYLKWDCGRMMPHWMCENIINNADNFDDFIRIQCCGKDGVSRGRPIRYGINTYCMKHTGTIEFRIFRATVNREELVSAFAFVERFMESALNGGDSVEEILRYYHLKFAPFSYNHEHYLAWENTKYAKTRGKKERIFHPM